MLADLFGIVCLQVAVGKGGFMDLVRGLCFIETIVIIETIDISVNYKL